ncbi:MAG TPA: CBS domain-containing protein [Rugosimonospora sp.]|nr:CBS domain-containing protein [Rugosimonospora sp.]
MQVRDAMSRQILTVGPEHTIRQVAAQMSQRRVGSAVVHDPESSGVGIMTERDVLHVIGRGLDPDVERAGDHLTWEVVYAAPSWSLTDAAAAMVRGGFRHLVVLEDGEVLGIISVRDILRVWAQERSLTTA